MWEVICVEQHGRQVWSRHRTEQLALAADGRILFGPYQAQEWPKYLEHEPEPAVAEGMIFDIDTSMVKVEMPKFDLAKFAKAHQVMVKEVVGGVLSRMEGELK